MTLSLCMIVKNEADVLERVLSNASLYADEIVIVDTGSCDGTKAIAQKFTDKIYDFAWVDDFSAARNYAVSKCTCDYWLWLDADDVVPDASARGIAGLKRTLDASVDIVMLPYVLETGKSDKPSFTFMRERIIKRDDRFVWRGRVHEAVTLDGKMISASFPVHHAKPQSRINGTRNLDIYKKMLAAGEKFEPRETYYFARELYFNADYSAAAIEFERFLSYGERTFKPNYIDACLMLSRCYNKLDKRDESLAVLFKSLIRGMPTGEIACEIGHRFYAKGDYATAAYWFERASFSKPDYGSGAFIDTECYNFLPYVWLTVCYDRLGKTRAAYYWHCRARKLKPDHPSVIANQKYFDGLNIRRKSKKHL